MNKATHAMLFHSESCRDEHYGMGYFESYIGSSIEAIKAIAVEPEPYARTRWTFEPFGDARCLRGRRTVFPVPLARCENCAQQVPAASLVTRTIEEETPFDDGLVRQDFTVCATCAATFRQYVFVNTYMITTVYGGPEEGGWSYDVTDPVQSVRCATEDRARTLVRAMGRLRMAFEGTAIGAYLRPAVSRRGPRVSIRCEDHPAYSSESRIYGTYA